MDKIQKALPVTCKSTFYHILFFRSSSQKIASTVQTKYCCSAEVLSILLKSKWNIWSQYNLSTSGSFPITGVFLMPTNYAHLKMRSLGLQYSQKQTNLTKTITIANFQTIYQYQNFSCVFFIDGLYKSFLFLIVKNEVSY